MKKRLTSILLILIFLAGGGIFLYPTLSELWNQHSSSRQISEMRSSLRQIAPEDYTQLWEAARQYSDSITQNTFHSDIFLMADRGRDESPYWDVLDIRGDGSMAYLHIPKIHQELPIYHGTSDGVLQKAVGHLSGTSLPIGGEGTHAVLAAHRGLPSARLFTDVDQLVLGDKLYIHVLDQTLAYEVDQILPMVDKDDLRTLTTAMQILPGEDHVTLLTCTPYGVNSHRLLIRGRRVPYFGEDEEEILPAAESMVRRLDLDIPLYFQAACLVELVILLVLSRKKKKRCK